MLLITQRRKPRDNHVVVFILRKAQTQLRKLGAELIDGQRGVLIDAQIDFGVDQFQFRRGLQAQLGQRIEAVAPVGSDAAQYETLAVVALLHAGVEVAVAVTGEEERLQKLERAVHGFAACIEIGLEIRIHVLVEAAKGVVIVAFTPHGKVQDAQRLQRLAEGARRKRGYAAKRIGQSGVACIKCGLTVAARQIQHGVDGDSHGAVFRPIAQLFPQRQQADRQHRGVVRRKIADVAELMNEMRGGDFFPLHVAKYEGQVGNGARKGDPFSGEKIRRFHFQRLFEPQGDAGNVGELRIAIGQL